MKIQQLIYLLKVLECKSITKAAQELYMSQPALTKAILSLEKEYNIRIFERSNKGILLTTEGKNFLHYAKNVVHNAEMLDNVFKLNKIVDKPYLLLGTQELDFISEIFVELYNKYNGEELEFELYKANRAQVIEAIKRGSCNMGIVVRTNRESRGVEWNLENNNLEVEILDTSNVYLHMGEKCSLYNKDIIEFKDVEGLPNICLDVAEQTRNKWRLDNKYIHINMNKSIYCNSINLCIELLKNTDLILFGQKWLNRFFEETPIRSIEITNNKEYVCELICITRKGESLNYIELEFIEKVKKILDMQKSYDV